MAKDDWKKVVKNRVHEECEKIFDKALNEETQKLIKAKKRNDIVSTIAGALGMVDLAGVFLWIVELSTHPEDIDASRKLFLLHGCFIFFAFTVYGMAKIRANELSALIKANKAQIKNQNTR